MKHNSELLDLKSTQNRETGEFLEEWDTYLQDEEAKAYEMIDKKKIKDAEDLIKKREEVTNQYHKFVHSKEYCKLKETEKIMFSVKNYIEAEKCSRKAQELEASERVFH